MPAREMSNDFFIWGIDDAPYGPVELPVLVNWVQDERVLANTWIFRRLDGTWRRAAEIPEIRMILDRKSPPAAGAVSGSGLTPGSLRRIKILADLNDEQLNQLIQYLEPQRIPQWAVVLKQGDDGDAMFLIMEGELRARVFVGGKETILVTFGAGEFFGDMALFDHGPRSADVVANADCVLLKITTASFDRLVAESPGLATPFLQATARSLAARIRADNKRLDRITQQFRMSGEVRASA
jgi:CRP-like cAMP-binding protein